MRTPKRRVFGLLTVLLLVASTSSAQDFSGSYIHPDRHALEIVYDGEMVLLTFTTPEKELSAKGVGYLLGGKLHFHFKSYATSSKSPGGSGIYTMRGNKIIAKHFHLDGSPRWEGVWTRNTQR